MQKIAKIYLGTILVFVFVGVFWTPEATDIVNINARFEAPNMMALMGRDHFGRDMLSMLMKGGGVTLLTALIAVSLALIIGVFLGLMSAAEKGKLIDQVVMQGNHIIFAFPAILTAIVLTAKFGQSAMNAMVAIAIFNVPVFTRMTRGAAMRLFDEDYVQISRLMGYSKSRIAFVHVLPNLASLLITQATIQFSLAILAEAGLSYIGFGVKPPMTSWGRMLSDLQSYYSQAPWLVWEVGLVIILTVLSLNILGDSLRKSINPRLKEGLDDFI